MSLQYVSQRAPVFMSPPYGKCDKAFATAATPVSVVVCMFADNVLVHGRPIHEPGRTERAAVWSLSRVGPHMSGEFCPRDKTGRAHMALVVLDSAMDLHMYSVTRHLVKRGTALLTPADHLPCVDAFV